jgi:hypothetical protein
MTNDQDTYRIELPAAGDPFVITIYGDATIHESYGRSRFRVIFEKIEHNEALFRLRHPVIHQEIRYDFFEVRTPDFRELFLSTARDQPLLCRLINTKKRASEWFMGLLLVDDAGDLSHP